jgi:hypothetical protein
MVRPDQGRQAGRYTLLVHAVSIRPAAQLFCLCKSIRVGGYVLHLTAWPKLPEPSLHGRFPSRGRHQQSNFFAWGPDRCLGLRRAGDARVAVLQNGEKSYVYPCFDFTTLADSLNNAGLSWKYYGVSKGTPGYVWSPFDAIRHIRLSPQWTTNVLDKDQFANDAANYSLAAVSWITTDVEESEHPGHDQVPCVGEELERGFDQRGDAESCVEFDGHFRFVGRFRWFL